MLGYYCYTLQREPLKLLMQSLCKYSLVTIHPIFLHAIFQLGISPSPPLT